jgi:hypothetical protein
MDLEQLEAFALGDDREAALARLVPGTEEHDYYRALWLQQRGRFDEVDGLLEGWASRHGQSERRERVRRRQLLHKLGRLDRAAIDEIVRELGVELNHQAEHDGERPRRPSRLDEALLDERGLVERARRRDVTLRSIADEGLPFLIDPLLDAARRRHLLARLPATPDERVVDLVAADLGEKGSGGFGSLAIHGRLTGGQLAALARARPELRGNEAWVAQMLVRIRPPAHVDWQGDRAARAAYLDEAVAFASTLPPSFNALRAHLLWHRLDNDRRAGRYDRGRFVEYLALPRRAGYVRGRWLERVEPGHVAEVGLDYAAATGLPAVDDEEGLVRDYLHRFLASEDGQAFAEWLEASWLERELATARLLAGDPDVERWAARLGAAAVAALRDRVDLDLALDNPSRLGAHDAVSIAAHVKNVPSLTLKVFRVDELAYFLAHGAEVTTAIDLDGLSGGYEATFRFDDPPMRRVRRSFDLSACAGPGTYVVELIGNGKSSRALVRKGRLRHAVRTGVTGAIVAVADEAGRPIADAAAWAGGREYRAGDDGLITIPFSTRPGRVPVLLVGGGVAQREAIDVPGEAYALAADVAVEREALAAGGTARALVRVRLSCAGAQVPIALLDEARVEIATTDGQGAASAREQPLALADDRDAVLEWAMPPDVAELRVTVRGKVRSVSEQRDVELSDGVTIEVGQIHRSAGTEALFLAETEAGWVLSVLGKTGEPRPRRQVNVTFCHRAVTDELTATLDTDERGRVELGRLEGVTQIAASATGVSQTWPLTGPAVAPAQLHVVEGERAVVPLPWYLRGEATIARAALFQLRGGAPARDANAFLRAEPFALAAEGLPADDYLLSVPGVLAVTIRVVPQGTPVVAGWAALPTESVELSPQRARLGACSADAEGLRVEVIDAGPATRVHVVATRLAPDPAGRQLAHPPRYVARRDDPAVECQYVSGRDLGDEYRYVLERRGSKKRPGIFLDRPGLLLNPWAVRSTSTEIALASEGTNFATSRARAAAPPARPQGNLGGRAGGGGEPGGAAYPSHDWVPRPVVIAANLRPDAEGVVTLERAALEGMGVVTVHCVEPGATTSRRLALAEATEAPRDLRLHPGLDPERHVVERKDVLGLPAGSTLDVDDLATARVEVVDTVGKAYRYLLALGDDPTLREFGFVAGWHELSPAEKLAKYGKFACHELHLFLYFKDPAFFAAVVRPYLANKRPLTFVDRWLLDDDLSRDGGLFRFGRLNAVERCLLARRAPPDVADAARRLIGDEVDLTPPDPERDARLVDALLGASALSGEGGEVHDALSQAREQVALAMMPAAFDELEAEEAGDRLASSVRASTAVDRDESPKARGGGGPRPAAPPPPVAQASPKLAKRAVGARSDGSLLDDLQRLEARRLEQEAPRYRSADLTREWAESNWWRHRPGSPAIAANRFWRDFAEWRGGPFLSPHLGLCAASFHEAMCALAALDLPFEAGKHEVRVAGGRMTLCAASNALVARRQLAEVAPAADAPPVLIGQNLVRADDRHEWDGEGHREKYVAGELLAGVVYTQLVAVTNPTSAPTRVDVLVQIPHGAIAVAGNAPTRTVHLHLGPYGTGTHEQSFYFPAPGRFGHYPAHVARKGELLAWAPPAAWQVASEPTTVDPTSWRHLSQRGSLEQVAAFLASANLGRVDLARVAFRLKDRAWFERVVGALAARGRFDGALWGYALLHRDRARIVEWLEHQDGWLRGAGPLEGGPVGGDEEERGWHEHLEYAPLVNARAHRLGARARILNEGLGRQYREALEWIAQRAPTDRDRLRAAHYLFTQDRLDEALALEAGVDPAHPGPRLQLDYLRAYAACARGDLAAARALAAPHADHPVERWRHRFAALVAMLDEAEGRGGPAAVDPDSRDQRMNALASRQPAFELSADAAGVTVDYRNLDALDLRYHRMDLELLFSRQPFVQSDVARFSFVDPGVTSRLELGGDGRARVAWPEGLARSSVVVEAVAAGARKAVAHYAHDLLVTVAHQYGQLHVARASRRAALPAAYVKVYGRGRGGEVAFFKDGYTDLRGRFDYATLSTDDLDRVERFAILIAADEAGALVVEAAPPAR